MSEPEKFLSRWSRRKLEGDQEPQEAGETADNKARDVEGALEGKRPHEQATPSPAATKPADLPFDLKDLPPIESITAATDLRPFLAPGVPAELTRAALRRAWVADPTIRNFVGLADYAWDYHEAGSMAGFGPLEMTEELRQVVARIIGPIAEVSGPRSDDGTESAAAVASSDEPKPLQGPQVAGSALPVPPPEAIDSKPGRPQDSPVNRQDVAGSQVRSALPTREHSAVQQQAAGRETIPSIVRRSHGGALPK